MNILHVMSCENWKHVSVLEKWDLGYIERIGYIPCCTDDTLKFVVSYYKSRYRLDELALLIIDSDKITSKIKNEEWLNSGNFYPHVYGPINNNAIIETITLGDYCNW